MPKSSTAYWRFDIATLRLEPSDRCRALYGRPEDAPFSYADHLDAIHPDDMQGYREALHRAQETGRFEANYRVVWPDGSVHRLLSLGSVGPVRDGSPVQIVGASIELPD